MPQIAVIWDFDHSLVDGNTDTWIVDQLCPEMRHLYQRSGEFACWTELMNDVMSQLHTAGFTSQQIRCSLHSMHIAPNIVEAIRSYHDRHIRQFIVSDANSIFIHEVLLAHHLDHIFPDHCVFTNPAWVDDADCMHVRRYHDQSAEPHGCPDCTLNMCKGRIVEQLRTSPIDCIMYVGDGKGDWCPTKRMRHCDWVFARQSPYALGHLWADMLPASSSCTMSDGRVC